jgi:hypothetical protein
MAQTNAALATGGIHQHCFSQGLSSFFQRLAHCFVRDGVDNLPLDQSRGQQPQGPPLSPFGRGATGQGDQMGFLLAVEAPLGRGKAGPGIQGGLQPRLGEALAHPLDGRPTRFQGLANLAVGPATAFVAGIRFEQDARSGQGACGGVATRDQALQSDALCFGESDEVLLLHR